MLTKTPTQLPRRAPSVFSSLQEEYEMTGMVAQSFELADPNIVSALRADGPLFKQAIAHVRSQGHFRVPYIFTDAIAAAAFDPALTSVIQAVFGESTPWVVWGPNIQQGTPNEADKWHVDIESWHWPTITVIIGLENCTSRNATRCIPFSQTLKTLPWSATDDITNDKDVKAAAKSLDLRCSLIRSFEDFQPGRFYLFNARAWHCGPGLSVFQDRELLILHYQKAYEPRIPYMYDYEKQWWFDEPAVYLEGPHLNRKPGQSLATLTAASAPKKFRTDLYLLPKNHQSVGESLKNYKAKKRTHPN